MREFRHLLLIMSSIVCLANVGSASASIHLENEYAKIHCPSGIDLNVPPGTKLEVTEHKFGDKLIVKVPGELNSMCEYGLLKSSNIKKYLADSKSENNLENKNSFKTLSNKKNKTDKKSELVKISIAPPKKQKTKIRVIAQVAKKMKFSDSCKQGFVSNQGLGDWGQFVKEELSSGQYPELLKNTKPFRGFCPGYRFMSSEEKKNVWVLLLMSMSHFESSCRPQVEAQGPNGIAKGLLQLHEGKENKYAHWDLDRVCKKGDSKNPKESLQCTLSMLNGQIEKFNSIFFQGSYWDVLRNVKDPGTHASKIKSAIQMLPGCGVRSVASDSSAKKKKTESGKG